MLGIVHKNKSHIPVSFRLNTSASTAKCSCDGKNITLSYCSKNEIVLCLTWCNKRQSSETGQKPENTDV